MEKLKNEGRRSKERSVVFFLKFSENFISPFWRWAENVFWLELEEGVEIMAGYESCLFCRDTSSKLDKANLKKVETKNNRRKHWKVVVYRYRKKTGIKREMYREWAIEPWKTIEKSWK